MVAVRNNLPLKVHLQRITSGGYKGAYLDPRGRPQALCGQQDRGNSNKDTPYSLNPAEVTCKACQANKAFINYQAGWDAAWAVSFLAETVEGEKP